MDTVRRKLEVVPAKHRPAVGRYGAIALALLGLALFFSIGASILGHYPVLPRGGTLVRAHFVSAGNLRHDTPVRIKGIDVGTVDGVTLRDRGRDVLVTMRVSSSTAHQLRADASASAWWRTVLGGQEYIELEPGTSRMPLGDQTIPVSRTSNQVELDQVLDVFRSGARQGIRDTLSGMRRGLYNAPAVKAAIDILRPALGPLAPALQAIRGQNPGDLQAMVTGFGHVLGALNRDETDLSGLVDNASTTFATTATDSSDIAALLDRGPAALEVTRQELEGLQHTLDLLDPVATELRPGARQLDPTLAELQPTLSKTARMLVDARPLVVDLRPAVSDLAAASRSGVPLIRGLNPTVDRVQSELLPWLYSTDPRSGRRVYELPGPTFAAVDSMGAPYDAMGHMVNFGAGPGLRSLQGFSPCTVYLGDPTAQRRIVCENIWQVLQSLYGGAAPKLQPVPHWTTARSGGTG